MKKNSSGDPARRFPLFISLSGKRILIVGGGKIAARRAKTLIDGQFGVEIQVVSPALGQEMEALFFSKMENVPLSWVQTVYDDSFLTEVDMVLACTDQPEINRRVYEDCRKKHILVNVASDQSMCDFHFPGILIEEDVVIAFNGGGMDHKKVKQLRRQIGAWLNSRKSGNADKEGKEEG